MSQEELPILEEQPGLAAATVKQPPAEGAWKGTFSPQKERQITRLQRPRADMELMQVIRESEGHGRAEVR